MPVRIYDLAKKLGLDSKSVLAKAKDLSIATAKVPSSSLDKITAEYLEEQLRPMARTEGVAAAPAPVEVSAPAAPPVSTAPPVEVPVAPTEPELPPQPATTFASPEVESKTVAPPAAPPIIIPSTPAPIQEAAAALAA